MKTKRFAFLLVAGGCLFFLTSGPSWGERPPKPGPDYTWDEYHTTPEGHYIPGRWIKASPASPEPSKATLKPGAQWFPPGVQVNPYTQPVAPIAPQVDYSVGLPFVLGAPYLVPPIVNGSLFWYGNYPYPLPGNHGAYPYGFRYPYGGYYHRQGKQDFYHGGYPGKQDFYRGRYPGKQDFYRGGYRGKHDFPPDGMRHPPYDGKHLRQGKPGGGPGKSSGKPTHALPAKPHGGFKAGKSVAPQLKEDGFDPHKK